MLSCRLQQLCTWPAKPSEERMRDPQNTALAVEHKPQQTSRQVMTACLTNILVFSSRRHEPLPAIMQVFKDPAAACPADKHGQHNMMPKWPDRQQVGQTVALNERCYCSVAQSPQSGRPMQLLVCRQQMLWASTLQSI